MQQFINDKCRDICKRLAGSEWEDLYHDTLIHLHETRGLDCPACYFYRSAFSVYVQQKRKQLRPVDYGKPFQWDDNEEMRYLGEQIETQGKDERSMLICEVVNRYCELGSVHKTAEDLGLSVGTVINYRNKFVEKAKKNHE